MRQLRLVLARRGGFTTLLLAAVLPAGGCGGKEGALGSGQAGAADPGTAGSTATGGDGSSTTGGTDTGGRYGTGGAGTGGRTATGGAATGGAFGAGGSDDMTWSTEGSTDEVPAEYAYPTAGVPAEQCSFPVGGEMTIVPLPPEGARPTVENLCADAYAPSVESGWAARVTLDYDAHDPTRVRGTVTVLPELVERVTGIPEVRVVDLDAGLSKPSIGTLSRSGDGFSFELVWPEAPWGSAYEAPPRLGLETVFNIDCSGEARQVRALTALYFCRDEMGEAGWASSGDRCIQCASVCEMAASPILPPKNDDTMALGGALRLGLRVVGKVHGALVLLAEHDGGANGVEYQWRVSGGKLVWVARDVALWLPPDQTGHGPELIQVAVSSASAAAVASLRWSAFG